MSSSPPADLPALLDIPSPFLLENSRVRVMEAPDAPLGPLFARLLDGSYDKPFIVEDGQLRYLHFSMRYVQSVMRIDAPDVLDLRYTQKMMAFLLFGREPERLALLGLGGGSLAKFCYRHLATTQIEAIEIDPRVIALRRHFAIPDDDARFRVVRGDAAAHIAARPARYDVLLADSFDADGLSFSLARRQFFADACAALRPGGILVMNLAGDKARYVDLLDDAHEVFDQQTILLRVNEDDNHILFAFKQRPFAPRWRQIKDRARELEARYALDFPAFAVKLEQAARPRGMALVHSIERGARDPVRRRKR